MKQTTQQLDQRKEKLVQIQQTRQNKIDSLKNEVSLDEREIKGIKLYEAGNVEIHDSEASTVMSESGKSSYLVNKKNGTCACKDHEFTGKYGVVCKHRVADKLAREELESESDDKDVVITFVDSIVDSVDDEPQVEKKVNVVNDPYGLLV